MNARKSAFRDALLADLRDPAEAAAYLAAAAEDSPEMAAIARADVAEANRDSE